MDPRHRYTLAELSTPAIDRLTGATPTGVLEGLENRVLDALDDLEVLHPEVEAAMGEAFARAREELDRIERAS